MANVVTAEPASEPVTLTEAKVQCRVNHAAEDGAITTLIKAARRHVEVQTRRSLITQTRTMSLARFPARSGVRLLYGPVQSIAAVGYRDAVGDDQTLEADEYQVDFAEDVPLLWPAADTFWPDVLPETMMAVTIEYVVGYGDEDDVPEPLKQAILLLVAHWYRNRLPVSEAAANPVGLTVDALIEDYKIPLMA